MNNPNEKVELDEYGAILVERNGKKLAKNVCPICGHEFYEVKELNVCKHHGPWTEAFTREELITDEDDYAWCL